jgi:hypothetical protein
MGGILAYLGTRCHVARHLQFLTKPARRGMGERYETLRSAHPKYKNTHNFLQTQCRAFLHNGNTVNAVVLPTTTDDMFVAHKDSKKALTHIN